MWTNPAAVRPSTSSPRWLTVIVAASAVNRPHLGNHHGTTDWNFENWDKMETVIILKLFWTESWLYGVRRGSVCPGGKFNLIYFPLYSDSNKQEKPTQFIYKIFRIPIQRYNGTMVQHNTVRFYPKQFRCLSCKHGLRWQRKLNGSSLDFKSAELN